MAHLFCVLQVTKLRTGSGIGGCLFFPLCIRRDNVDHRYRCLACRKRFVSDDGIRNLPFSRWRKCRLFEGDHCTRHIRQNVISHSRAAYNEQYPRPWKCKTKVLTLGLECGPLKLLAECVSIFACAGIRVLNLSKLEHDAPKQTHSCRLFRLAC